MNHSGESVYFHENFENMSCSSSPKPNLTSLESTQVNHTRLFSPKPNLTSLESARAFRITSTRPIFGRLETSDTPGNDLFYLHERKSSVT